MDNQSNQDKELLQLYFADLGDVHYITQAEEKEIFQEVEYHRDNIKHYVEKIFGRGFSIRMGVLWLDRARQDKYKSYLVGIQEKYNVSESDVLYAASEVLRSNSRILVLRELVMHSTFKLVAKIARSYLGLRRGLGLSDLIQEGNLGLFEGFDRFRVKMGYRFTTYASWWVRHMITKAVNTKSSVIRVPSHILQEFTRLERFEKDFVAENGRDPSYDEIIDHFGQQFADAHIVELRDVHRKITPFNVVKQDSDERPNVEDMIGVEDDLERYMYELNIDGFVAARFTEMCQFLTTLEREVLFRQFNIRDRNHHYTTEEIGNELHIPIPRVLHIGGVAILKIRNKYNKLDIEELIDRIRKSHEHRHNKRSRQNRAKNKRLEIGQ